MPRCLFLYPNNAFFWSRGKWKRVIQIWDCSCRIRSPLIFLLSDLKPKADHILLCFHLCDTEDLMPSTKYLCKNDFIISVCKRWITVFYIFSFCWRSFWSFDFNLSGKRTTSSSYNTAFPSYLISSIIFLRVQLSRVVVLEHLLVDWRASKRTAKAQRQISNWDIAIGTSCKKNTGYFLTCCKIHTG